MKNNLNHRFAERGYSLSNWAKLMGLSKKDIQILHQISAGNIIGKRGRAKELLMLIDNFLKD